MSNLARYNQELELLGKQSQQEMIPLQPMPRTQSLDVSPYAGAGGHTQMGAYTGAHTQAHGHTSADTHLHQHTHTHTGNTVINQTFTINNSGDRYEQAPQMKQAAQEPAPEQKVVVRCNGTGARALRQTIAFLCLIIGPGLIAIVCANGWQRAGARAETLESQVSALKTQNATLNAELNGFRNGVGYTNGGHSAPPQSPGTGNAGFIVIPTGNN